MADNTILQANVELKIDTTTIDKQISNATKKIETGLSKADGKLSKQLSKQIDRDLGKVSRQFERGADKLSKGLEKGLKFGLGVGATAIYTFLKNGTPEALRFANSLDKVKMAWGKVGQNLATRVNFGGKSLNDWVNTLANRIENLDISQIQRMVDMFMMMAKTWATIKIGQGIVGLSKLSSDLSSLMGASKSLQNIGTSASVGSSIVPLAGASAASAAAGMALSNPRRRIFDKWKDVKPLPMERGLKDLYDQAKRFGRREMRVGSTFYPMDKVEKVFGDAPMTWKDKIASSRVGQSWSGSRSWMRAGAKAGGIGALASAGTDLAMGALSNWAGGRNAFEGLDVKKVAQKSLFSAGGATLGAMIGSAILPGIGTLVGGSIGYLTSSEFFNQVLGVVPTEKMTAEEGARAAKERMAFGRVGQARKGSEAFGKGLQTVSSRYAGEIPVSERKQLMADAIKNINLQTSSIKELQGMQQTDTVKQQIADLEKSRETLKSFVDGTIALEQRQEEEKKKHLENMEKFDEEIKKAYDKEAKAKYENTKELDKLAKVEKSIPSKIGMGGDITSIPQIMSEALNDIENDKFDLLKEQTQRLADIDELLLQHEEERIEREKELAEIQKQRAKEAKEFEDNSLKNQETLNKKLGDGGYTTINEF